MNTRLAEHWEELTDFIVFRNSLDIGALSRLLDIFTQDSGLDPSIFADQVTAFLAAIASQAKLRPQGEADLLAILSVDALIANLYLYSRNGQAFQPNSSSFYGWMSSSQMSMDHSHVQQREGKAITEMIAALANSQPFFKRLKASMEKVKGQQKIKKYVESLLQAIDPILSAEHLSRDNFLKFRGKYVGLQSRRKWQLSYSGVNNVIFSSQLNKIVAVLAESSDDVHLALLRIYLSCNEELKMFEGVKYSGQEMLTNLYRYYVNSFRDIDQLFQEGKHPLFRLLRNHLALLFTPVLRRFHQIVVKIAPRCGSEPGFDFYKSGKQVLESELGDFINDLPNELLKLLMQLKDLIEEQHPGQPEMALSGVKKLFFYSFLLNQALMEELYPRHDPSKWDFAYNHILYLFFQGSLSKFSHLPQNQSSYIGQIIEKLAGSLDSRITNQYLKLQQDDILAFKIKQSVLNHDFEMVMGLLSSLEFTPKDSKQFEMKKMACIAPQSPVYKHLKGQGFKAEQGEQQLQLAAWMSVGGSRQWGVRPSRMRRGGVGERLKGFKTISLSARVQLSSESESFRQYFDV